MSVRRATFALTMVVLAGSAWAFNAEDLLIDLTEATGAKQHEAALRLGDFNYPDVIKGLSEKLDDKNTSALVRAACAQSLGKLNDASTYAMIGTLARSREEKGIIRSACVQAMGAMKGADAIDEFVEILKTERVRLVVTTIEEVLGEMTEKDRVVVAMSPLLKDATLAPSAIRVLGKVGGPRVVMPLAEQLESPRTSIRMAVIVALGNVRTPEAAERLLAYYPKSKDVLERSRILKALAEHPHPKVVALLIGELQDTRDAGGRSALRRRAAFSLGAMRPKPKQAIKPLVGVMLKTTEHLGLRRVCVQALGGYSDRDDYAIAGLIGVLADKKLQSDAAIALNRITNRYFGTNQEKWTAWFQEWRRTRDQRRSVGH